MTTRLILTAPLVLEAITARTFYPHLISFETNTKRWILNSDPKERKGFYFVNLVLIPIVGVGTMLIQILKYFVLQDRTVGNFTLLFFAVLVLLSTLSSGLNIPTIWYGKYMVNYVNALMNFEDQIKRSAAHHNSPENCNKKHEYKFTSEPVKSKYGNYNIYIT